jgi:hypothetical protein
MADCALGMNPYLSVGREGDFASHHLLQSKQILALPILALKAVSGSLQFGSQRTKYLIHVILAEGIIRPIGQISEQPNSLYGLIHSLVCETYKLFSIALCHIDITPLRTFIKCTHAMSSLLYRNDFPGCQIKLFSRA